jgi:hypothetical protein
LIATNIIRQAAAEGVELVLSGSGAIKASGPRGAVLRWQPVIVEHKPAIVAALSAANDALCEPEERGTPTPSDAKVDASMHMRRLAWRIVIPGREPFTTVVFPEATLEWMREFYPTATRIEPIEEQQRRATAVQAVEFAALVDVVLANESAAARQEALGLALADPVEALLCDRTLRSARGRIS